MIRHDTGSSRSASITVNPLLNKQRGRDARRCSASLRRLLTPILFLLGALASVLLPLKARAVCTATPLNLVASGNPSISVPADSIPIGTRIGTWQATGNVQYVFNGTGTYPCGFGTGVTINYADAAPRQQPTGVTYVDAQTGKNYDVYAIPGVSGVGYAIGIQDYNNTNIANETPLRSPVTQTYPFQGSNTTTNSIGYKVRMVLVATGQLKSGSIPIPTTTLADLRVKGDISSLPPTTTLNLNGGFSVNVVASGCYVNDPASRGVTQTVTMPDLRVNSADISGQANSKDFSISLKCDGAVTVRYTMTDAGTPANTGTILRPNGNSTAQGVGIQVSDKIGVVSFGPDSSAIGNPNQRFFAGGAPNAAQTYTMPFSAKYVVLPEYITGNGGIKGVKPGHFETAATITFSYQ